MRTSTKWIGGIVLLAVASLLGSQYRIAALSAAEYSAFTAHADSLDPLRIYDSSALLAHFREHYALSNDSDELDASGKAVTRRILHYTYPPDVEANDAQKLIVKTGNTYSYRGVLSAYVTQPYPPSFNGWKLVAQLEYPDLTYPVDELPRGMRNRVTCVYLARGKTWPLPGAGYDAALAPADGNDLCLPARNDLPIDKTLDVSNVNEPGTTSADYPETVRLDWNGTQSEHLQIGVPCKDEWCTIKLKGHGNGPNYPKKAKGKVRGWFDEQYLADATGTAPTGTVGTIIPVNGTTDPHFYDCQPCTTDSYKDAAEIKLSAGEAKYAMHYGLAVPVGDGPWNVLQLRRNKDITDPRMQFEARVKSATGGGYKKLSVNFVDHTDPTHPPQLPHVGARWRWRNNDESMWVSCATGCCDVYDGIMLKEGVPTPADTARKPTAGQR